MAAKCAQFKGRSGWYLVDHHPSHKGGRKVEAYGEDRAACEADAAAINVSREFEAQGIKVDPTRSPLWGGVTIEAWFENESAGLSRTTRVNTRSLIDRNLVPYFGQRDLRLLDRGRIRAFAADMASRGMGQHSVKNSLSVLRRVLKWCTEEPRCWLVKVPVDHICAEGVRAAAANGAKKGRREAWSLAEVETMLGLASSQPELYSMLLLAHHTGARKSELIGLKWEAVDFGRRRIHFHEAVNRFDESKAMKENDLRGTDISPALLAHLESLAKKRPRFGSDEADGPVLLNSLGQRWVYSSLSSSWKRLQKRALAKGVRPLPFHCWRHTFVSLAMATNRPPGWIARQIGDTVETMLRNYAHFIPGREETHDFLSSGAGSGEPEPRAAAGELG